MKYLTRKQGAGAKTVRQQGFTLIELLVVLVIIALLASLVAPKLFGRADTARVQTAQAQIKMLKGALDTFRFDTGRYPTNEEGLAILINPPADPVLKNKWKGPYLDAEQMPLDPWDNAYQYAVPGANNQPFALYSFGADKKKGGEGTESDVGILP